MSWVLVLPILVPLATALLCFAVRGPSRLQRALSVAGAGGLLAVAILLLREVLGGGILVSQMGDWPAPFGISLVADRLAAIMVVITGIVAVATVVYALADIDPERQRFGFHPLFHILITGICGAFLTGDLFNLYVWFEVMLIASFALLVLGGERAQIDGAVKYVALNLISTVMFLSAVGLLYGMTGTLNMAELHVRVREVENTGLLSAVAMLFLVAFGIKAAIFPLFFWLPAAYHTPPVAVSAVFSALLTKVGVYALIRVFTLIFTHDVGYTHTTMLIVAAATMVTGVLGAAAQTEIRRILSFHIISQIGYMILGLALFTPLGLIGAVFYLVHHIIVKANLFLVSGVANRLGGSFDLNALGGLYAERGWLAILFLIPAFSLAGFPPLSGFWAKLLLIQASLEIEAYWVAAVALVVGLLTIYSMTKIWNQAFWRPRPQGAAVPAAAPSRGDLLLLTLPIAGMALLTLVIGIWVQPFLTVAGEAAAELLDPRIYVTAVLGRTP